MPAWIWARRGSSREHSVSPGPFVLQIICPSVIKERLYAVLLYEIVERATVRPIKTDNSSHNKMKRQFSPAQLINGNIRKAALS